MVTERKELSRSQRETFKKFSTFVMDRGIKDRTFPYARYGLRVFVLCRRFLITGAVLAAIGFVVRLVAHAIPVPQAYHVDTGSLGMGGGAEPGSDMSIPDVPVDKWVVGLVNALTGLGSFLYVLAWVAVAGAVIAAVVYALVVVKRWQAFERHCLINDYRAERIRKQVLRASSAKRYVREAKRAVKKEKDGDDPVSQSTEAKLASAKALTKLKVFVNCRQSMDVSDKVLRIYQMECKIPINRAEGDEFLRLVDSLDQTANSASKLHFGQRSFDENGRVVSWVDQVSVKDRYKRRDKSGGEHEVVEYGSSFPLSLFDNHEEENKEIRMLAQRYAETKAIDLDSMLKTLDIQARRERVVLGASTAKVVYDLSYSVGSGVDLVDQLSKKLDKNFKTSGTTVAVNEGKLEVGLPLGDRSLKVDVASMYADVFGAPNKAKG